MEQPDLIRDALQVRINESLDGGNFIVAHYVAVVGVVQVNPDGSTEGRVVIAAPDGQADYITHGLLGEAPEVLAAAATAEENADDETA